MYKRLLLSSACLVLFSPAAMGEDKQAPAEVANLPVAQRPVLLREFNSAKPRLGAPGRDEMRLPGEDLCYTMRTYKMKPKERLKEGESASAGYSICQMASNYRFRSADVSDQK